MMTSRARNGPVLRRSILDNEHKYDAIIRRMSIMRPACQKGVIFSMSGWSSVHEMEVMNSSTEIAKDPIIVGIIFIQYPPNFRLMRALA